MGLYGPYCVFQRESERNVTGKNGVFTLSETETETDSETH